MSADATPRSEDPKHRALFGKNPTLAESVKSLTRAATAKGAAGKGTRHARCPNRGFLNRCDEIERLLGAQGLSSGFEGSGDLRRGWNQAWQKGLA